MAGFRTSGVEVSGVVFLRTRPDASVRRSDCHHHRPTVTRASPTTPRCAHRAMPVFWGTTFVAVGNRCFRRSTTGTQRVRYVKASDEQTGHCWSSWISSQSRHKRATRSRISFKFNAQTLRREAPFWSCKISRTRATKSLPPRRLCCDKWLKPPALQAWGLGGILAVMDPVVPTSDRPSTRLETLIGLTLAVCVHPVAAWASGSVSIRLLCFLGYFLASYVLTILALRSFAS